MGRSKKDQDGKEKALGKAVGSSSLGEVGWMVFGTKTSIPTKNGNGRASTSFQQMRITPSGIEIDYTFHTGGSAMRGTLEIAYSADDEIMERVQEITGLCHEVFERVRKARN